MTSRFPWLLAATVAGLTLGTANASAAPARPQVAVVPVSVAGEESGTHVQERFDSSLRQALAGGTFTVVQAAADGACASAECYVELGERASASLVVRGTAAVEGRDYTVRVELIDARTGSVVRKGETTCEICTFGEAAEKLGFEAAAMRDAITELLGETSAADADGPAAEPAPAATDHEAVVEPGFGHTADRARTNGNRTGPGRPVKIGLGAAALGVGVASLAAGLTLIVLHDRPYQAKCSGSHVDINGTCEFRYDTLTGGIVAAAVGLVGAVGGATVLGLTLRNTNVRASVGPRGASVTWRFR